MELGSEGRSIGSVMVVDGECAEWEGNTVKKDTTESGRS